MRHYILLLCFLLATLDSYAHSIDQPTYTPPPKEKVKKKKRQKREEKGFQFGIALPGWVIRTGVNIALKPKKMNKEERESFDKIRPILRRMSSVRVLVSERAEASRKGERLRKRFFSPQSRKRVESLIKVRDGDTQVNIFVKLKRKKKKTVIKKLVVLVEDEGEMVLVVLNGRWDTKTLRKAIKELNMKDLKQAFN